MAQMINAMNSGLALSDEELQAVEGIEELLAEYESKGSKYTLSTSCKQFVSLLTAGKTQLKVGSLNMEGVAHARFVDTVEQLARELVEYQEAENELAEVQQRVEDGILVTDENVASMANSNNKGGSSSSAAVHREYLHNEKMLAKLVEEQATVDAAIRQRQKRKEQVLMALENDANDVSSKPAVHKSVMSTDPHAEAEMREFQQTLAKIEATKEEADALLEGLKSLTGLASIRIEPCGGAFGGMQLVADLGALGVLLKLDADRRLVDIVIAHGSYPHTADILSDAIVLPSPQDLRYAVFALGAVQKSSAILTQHTAELRQKCIVRSNGYTAKSSMASVQITLSNGVTASFSVHACYPELPGGVSIDSLVGVGGWTMQELEVLRVTANAKCFSSLLDMMDHLVAVTNGR